MAYCGHCQTHREHKDKRCVECGKLIWELIAKQCDNRNPLRTTDKTYAALVRYGAK